MSSTSVLSQPEIDALWGAMPDGDLKDGVKAGVYRIVAAGIDPTKPVVVWAAGERKGRRVPGTGVTVKGAMQAGINSKRTGYKRSNDYQAVMERRYGIENGGFDRLLDAADAMIEDKVLQKKVTCPCGCNVSFTVEMVQKGNPLALKLIFEKLVGRATEKKEVDVNIRALLAEVDARTPMVLETIEVPADRKRLESGS